MRYAIIDNSTLTAAQRLLGDIPIVNKLCIDGDIAAFENLVQAILFYDAVFFVDDYKEEHRQSRSDRFPFLIPISTKSFPYESFRVGAAEFVSDLMLYVKGGQIRQDDLGKFLETLKLHTTFTWDMRSSDWFLTMKMLSSPGDIGVNKYTKLKEMIFTELPASSDSTFERPVHQLCELIGSDGQPIRARQRAGSTTYEVTREIYAFASSLNWLSLRTAFYTFLGSHYSADALLHPIRSAFQLSLAGRLGLEPATFQPVLDRLIGNAEATIREIRAVTDPVIVDADLPIFSCWLANKTRNPSLIFEEALRVRTTAPFAQAREQLSELESTTQRTDRRDFVVAVNKLVLSVNKTLTGIRQIYGVETKNGVPLAPVISVLSAFAKLKGLPGIPNVPLKVPLPDRILELGMRNGFKGVFRSVTQDLTSIARLGEVHEILTSRVSYSASADEYHAKTEDIKFLGKRSHWKTPM